MVQSTSSALGSTCGGSLDGGSYSLAFPAPNTPGNAIVVYAYWAQGYSDAGQVSDSQGNHYNAIPALVSPQVSSGQHSVAQFFYAPAARGGPNTVTLAVDGGFSKPVGLALFEYAGLDPAETLDAASGQPAPSSTANASTPALQTSGPGDVLLAAFLDVAQTGTITPEPGWSTVAAQSCFYMMVEQSIASAQGMYGASATMPRSDNYWVASLAAFRPAPLPQYTVGCACRASTLAPSLPAMAWVLALCRRRRRGRSGAPAQ